MARSIFREKIETERIPRYNNEDLPTTLSFHLEALQKSGFREVHVYWKYYSLAVFGGLKHLTNRVDLPGRQEQLSAL